MRDRVTGARVRMKAEVYWVEGFSLAIMPRPRGGEWLADEMASLARQGVKVLVSLLEDSEVRELELRHEGRLGAEVGIEFHSHPIGDRGVPDDVAAFGKLIAVIVRHVRSGAGVAIHCRGGIGRSGTMAAVVLHSLGVEVSDAFALLTKARHCAVPDTDGQRTWATRHAAGFRA